MAGTRVRKRSRRIEPQHVILARTPLVQGIPTAKEKLPKTNCRHVEERRRRVRLRSISSRLLILYPARPLRLEFSPQTDPDRTQCLSCVLNISSFAPRQIGSGSCQDPFHLGPRRGSNHSLGGYGCGRCGPISLDRQARRRRRGGLKCRGEDLVRPVRRTTACQKPTVAVALKDLAWFERRRDRQARAERLRPPPGCGPFPPESFRAAAVNIGRHALDEAPLPPAEALEIFGREWHKWRQEALGLSRSNPRFLVDLVPEVRAFFFLGQAAEQLGQAAEQLGEEAEQRQQQEEEERGPVYPLAAPNPSQEEEEEAAAAAPQVEEEEGDEGGRSHEHLKPSPEDSSPVIIVGGGTPSSPGAPAEGKEAGASAPLNEGLTHAGATALPLAGATSQQQDSQQQPKQQPSTRTAQQAILPPQRPSPSAAGAPSTQQVGSPVPPGRLVSLAVRAAAAKSSGVRIPSQDYGPGHPSRPPGEAAPQVRSAHSEHRSASAAAGASASRGPEAQANADDIEVVKVELHGKAGGRALPEKEEEDDDFQPPRKRRRASEAAPATTDGRGAAAVSGGAQEDRSPRARDWPQSSDEVILVEDSPASSSRPGATEVPDPDEQSRRMLLTEELQVSWLLCPERQARPS